MRVTWVALECPRTGQHSGGVGRYIYRLAEQMAAHVDLSVLAFEGAAPVPGVTLMTIPPPSSRIDRFYGKAFSLRRVLEQSGEVEILHSHGDDWLARHSAPRVRTFYGTAKGEARSSSGLRKINHHLLALTEEVSSRRASVKIAIAPESMASFGCDILMTPYLPVSRVRSRQPHKQPTVVFIGAYHGRKRGAMVEQAVRSIRQSSTGQNLAGTRLVVIGPDLDKGAWPSWVEHMSGLSDREVLQVIDSAWVLASPSKYEGFGIPIIEALDGGVRVVASPNPGTDFLRGLRDDADAALTVVPDAQFEDALRSQLMSGPEANDKQRVWANILARDVIAMGSPERLLGIYQTLGQ